MRKRNLHFDHEAVADAGDAGEKPREVARRFGISGTSVHKAVREAHPERPKRTRRARVDDAEVERLHRAELRAAEIAGQMKIAKSSVYRALIRRGIRIDPSPNRVELDDTKLIEEYEEKRSLRTLAERHGVTHKTVAARIERGGGRLRSQEVRLPTAQVVEAYRRHTSAAELARRFKTTAETIKRRLQDAGVATRGHREAAGKPDGATSWHREERSVWIKRGKRWRHASHLMWERAHGPLPAGCILVRVDKELAPGRIDRLDNLVLIGKRTLTGLRWAKGRIDVDADGPRRRELLRCIVMIAALKNRDTQLRFGTP